ncbi:hydroxyproline-rich protein [Senna tora]|uniref:Hydroxyproline-rich protein n=1 Tax=Senna tora TaxID=362788 RepID=A0A834THX9_9FABA|nr:hydroxyproline-rich protein [Senna tora]
MLQTPPKPPIQSKTTESDCRTPPPLHPTHQNDQITSPYNELRKPLTVTPDRLRVPKAFKYPERYTSPTDMMVSPVTKGLLARSRRGGGALIPPGGKTQSKEVGLFENKEQRMMEEN